MSENKMFGSDNNNTGNNAEMFYDKENRESGIQNAKCRDIRIRLEVKLGLQW